MINLQKSNFYNEFQDIFKAYNYYSPQITKQSYTYGFPISNYNGVEKNANPPTKFHFLSQQQLIEKQNTSFLDEEQKHNNLHNQQQRHHLHNHQNDINLHNQQSHNNLYNQQNDINLLEVFDEEQNSSILDLVDEQQKNTLFDLLDSSSPSPFFEAETVFINDTISTSDSNSIFEDTFSEKDLVKKTKQPKNKEKNCSFCHRIFKRPSDMR
ncbi:hypothetical protein HK099_003025, partial [Clydaea vesicula]